ncbi:hypothetical protein COLO4_26420 [Corchorus olitorius]|uniref:TF-B3 domain-containing protein n=1 Tax=Corchorus olitorius TaxID=93759 RepID=A0A1R3HXD4_9ROSI|nr:hypothetical protein COLO4_26420 [Corchorus olitorius]
MESNKHGQKWQEEVYWNCFKRQGFFANLPCGFHEQLAIPKKFALKLRNKLPETATLKGPSGLTWSVDLTRDGDALFFTNGWAEFVKDQSLEENDLLIFRFNGESSFNVWVYDPSNGTEKEALYFPVGSRVAAGAGDAQGQGHPKRREKPNVVFVKSPSEEMDGNASHAEKSGNEDGCDRTPLNKSASDDGNSSQAAPSRRYATSPSRPRKIPRLKRIIDTEPAQNRGAITSNAGRKPGKFKIVSKRRAVTEKEKSDTLQAARELEASSPDSLMVVMRPYMVYHTFRLSIGSDWVKKHLSRVQEVILRLKNQEKTWKVGFYLVKSRYGGLLTTNWKRFVVDNGLEEDDVCVFKPGGRSPDQKFIIDVTIFRVVEKEMAQS